MGHTLPAYMMLADAAQRYHLSKETLTRAVAEGLIRAIQAGQDILVAKEDLVVLTATEFAVDPTLAGHPIRAAEAADRYKVNQDNLTRWAYAGYIRILDQAPKLLMLDEGDVARVVAIFHCAYQETGSFIRAGWVLKRVLTQTQHKIDTGLAL